MERLRIFFLHSRNQWPRDEANFYLIYYVPCFHVGCSKLYEAEGGEGGLWCGNGGNNEITSRSYG